MPESIPSAIVFVMYCAPINVSAHPPPLPGEVRQSWGFDLIRIQLPHLSGKFQIQIPPSYTGLSNHGLLYVNRLVEMLAKVVFQTYAGNRRVLYLLTIC